MRRWLSGRSPPPGLLLLASVCGMSSAQRQSVVCDCAMVATGLKQRMRKRRRRPWGSPDVATVEGVGVQQTRAGITPESKSAGSTL